MSRARLAGRQDLEPGRLRPCRAAPSGVVSAGGVDPQGRT